MKKTFHTLLIICEGENTEPFLFNSIRNEIMDGNYELGNIRVTIRPEPILDDNEPHNPSPYKAIRKKLKTRKATVGAEPADINAPLPLKWVLEGQKELEDATFSEVWTVFDHDHFPARKEAFETAMNEINGKKVNIAFSSICFEYYLLLHFQRIYKDFATSECRMKDEKGKNRHIECSTGKQDNDCFGNRCIGGYARKKQYWNTSKERESMYPLIRNRLEIAFENSAWLRHRSDIHEPTVSLYDRNPYITTDALFKRLVGKDHIQWIWLKSDVEYTFNKLKIKHDNATYLIIENSSNVSIIIPNNSFYKIKEDFTRESFGEKIFIEPATQCEIKIGDGNCEREYYLFIYENFRIMFEFKAAINV